MYVLFYLVESFFFSCGTSPVNKENKNRFKFFLNLKIQEVISGH